MSQNDDLMRMVGMLQFQESLRFVWFLPPTLLLRLAVEAGSLRQWFCLLVLLLGLVVLVLLPFFLNLCLHVGLSCEGAHHPDLSSPHSSRLASACAGHGGDSVADRPPCSGCCMCVRVWVCAFPFHCRGYNSVVEETFTRCVHGFRGNTLTEREKKCVAATAAKLLKGAKRIDRRFSEAQARMNAEEGTKEVM